jgi:hypothetical protein
MATLANVVTFYVTPNSNNSNGKQIMFTTLWYFFVLLNVFYGGALTMFFTSTITIPFEGIVDVMREYPDWKLMFKAGSEVDFSLPASDDPDYAEYWTRAQLYPEEARFNTIKEGLDMMNNDRIVLSIQDSLLKGYFRANPFHVQRLDIFSTVEIGYSCLTFSFNSPLKAIFEKSITDTREKGVQHNLQIQWIGGALNQNWLVEKMVLTPARTGNYDVCLAARCIWLLCCYSLW